MAGSSEKGGKTRVLIAKPGLDGHDRGAKVLANAFKDAGFEVIYLGLRQTPESIAVAAVDENVDVVCLSCLSGAHDFLFPEVVSRMKQMGAGEIPVLGGGLIPKDDFVPLKEKGVTELFESTAPMAEIVSYVKELCAARQG